MKNKLEGCIEVHEYYELMKTIRYSVATLLTTGFEKGAGQLFVAYPLTLSNFLMVILFYLFIFLTFFNYYMGYGLILFCWQCPV